jgi:hypothetical protein
MSLSALFFLQRSIIFSWPADAFPRHMKPRLHFA